MKFSIVLSTLVSAVFAAKYYGKTPTVSEYAAIEEQIKQFEVDGAKVVSVLRMEPGNIQAIQDFYSSGDMNYTTSVFNKHKRDIASSAAAIQSAPVPDAPISYTCYNDAVALSTTAQYQICSALATVVGGGIATVGYIIQNAACSEAKTGHPVRCNAAFIFATTTGAGVSVYQINSYCPALLSKIKTTCSNRGGGATNGERDVVFEENLKQGSPWTCNEDQGAGKCKTTTA